jgi:hypothetical protein
MLNDVSAIEAQASLRGAGTEQAQAARNMNDQFLKVAVANGGTIPGAELAGFLKKGGDLDSLINANNPDVADVGRNLKDALLAAGGRGSSASADAIADLQGGRQQWKAIQTVRPAIDTTAAGSEEMNPQRLARLIQNKYDMTYTGAGNDMQDLARVINSTKPLPSSGTAERLQRMQLWSSVPGMLGIGAAGAAGAAGLAAYDPNAAEHAADVMTGAGALALAGRMSRFGMPGAKLVPRLLGGEVGEYGRNALAPPTPVNPLLRGVGPPQ